MTSLIIACIALVMKEREVKRKLAVATSMKDTGPVGISSSTPVMASIMKEETENRELVSRHFEEKQSSTDGLRPETKKLHFR